MLPSKHRTMSATSLVSVTVMLLAGAVSSQSQPEEIVNNAPNQPRFVVIDARRPLSSQGFSQQIPIPLQQTLVALSQNLPKIFANSQHAQMTVSNGPGSASQISNGHSQQNVDESSRSATSSAGEVDQKVTLQSMQDISAKLGMPVTKQVNQVNSQSTTGNAGASAQIVLGGPILQTLSASKKVSKSSSAQLETKLESQVADMAGKESVASHPVPVPSTASIDSQSVSSLSKSSAANSEISEVAPIISSSTTTTIEAPKTTELATSTITSSSTSATIQAVAEDTVTSMNDQKVQSTTDLEKSHSKIEPRTSIADSLGKEKGTLSVKTSSSSAVEGASEQMSVHTGGSSKAIVKQSTLSDTKFRTRIGLASDAEASETKQEEVAAQDSEITETEPAQESEVTETEPAQESEVTETEPAQESEVTETEPAQESEITETEGTQGSENPEAEVDASVKATRIMPGAEEVTARRLEAIERLKTTASSSASESNIASNPSASASTTIAASPSAESNQISLASQTTVGNGTPSGNQAQITSIADVFKSISRAAVRNVAKVAALARSRTDGFGVEPILVGAAEGVSLSEPVGVVHQSPESLHMTISSAGEEDLQHRQVHNHHALVTEMMGENAVSPS